MKKILSTLLIIIMANTLGQAQKKECALEQPHHIPKEFFNSENYIFSCNYDSVCIPTTSTVFFPSPYRWLSLFGAYNHTITSVGGYTAGNYIEFSTDGRLCIFRGVGKRLPVLYICGDYKFDSSNGLLYIRWDKSDDSFFQGDFVCQICYYTAIGSEERYKEALQLSRYIGATWDMSLEQVEECQTTPLFEILVRNRGI